MFRRHRVSNISLVLGVHQLNYQPACPRSISPNSHVSAPSIMRSPLPTHLDASLYRRAYALCNLHGLLLPILEPACRTGIRSAKTAVLEQLAGWSIRLVPCTLHLRDAPRVFTRSCYLQRSCIGFEPRKMTGEENLPHFGFCKRSRVDSHFMLDEIFRLDGSHRS